MGKKSAEDYFKALSNARKRQNDVDPMKLKKWTGGKLKPRVKIEKWGFQDKPRKEKAKTIRNILKQAHPKAKFSVKTTRGYAIRINWLDGPSVEDVKKLQFWRYASQYPDGRGGTASSEYLFLNREYSKKIKDAETKRILGKYADVAKMPAYRKTEIVYGEMHKTAYPGAKSPGLAKVSGVARSPKKV